MKRDEGERRGGRRGTGEGREKGTWISVSVVRVHVKHLEERVS